MLHQQMMPHDVSTCWNSTYDMLEFSIEYCEALESITGNQRMKLRQYELTKEYWKIATFLHDVLRVCCHSTYHLTINEACSNKFSRTPPSSFHMVHPALPLWYLPWITSMNTSPMRHLIPSIPCQLKQLFQLGRRLSISTTIKQTTLKCFGLQWVQFIPLFTLHLSLTSDFSPPSLTQTRLLQKCWMGGLLGCEGWGNCLYWVWMLI